MQLTKMQFMKFYKEFLQLNEKKETTQKKIGKKNI